MNLTIKASKTTLTEAIQNDIETKFAVLEDFLRPEHKVHMEIEADASHDLTKRFRAEVSIQPDGYFAESTAGDMYEAIDLLVPKIRQQLTRDKDKRVSLRRKLGVLKRFWNRGR